MVTEKLKRITTNLVQLALKIGAVCFLAVFFRPIWVVDGVNNYVLLAVIVGFPFGIGKMIVMLPPASYGIGGGMGVLALDLIVGGVIGCVCLAYNFIANLIRLMMAIIA